MRLGTLAALAAVTAAVAPPVTAQLSSEGPRPLHVVVTARTVEPGEVARIDVRSERPIASLSVNAFDAVVPAVQIDARHWRALVGIDLDTAPGEYPITIEAVLAGGATATEEQPLPVSAKNFPTRELSVAPKFVNPPPSVERRITRERQRLSAIFRTVGPTPRWRGPFVRPIEVTVISGFGVRSVYNGEARAPHGGADFASPSGTPIAAPGGGIVVLAEPLYFTGHTVVLDHGLGLVSLFAHLSRIDVAVGDEVAVGRRLGLVGATGRVTGPHLHWTVRLLGARVDPMSLIAALDETE
jgi:murein DD-endopeptidase MepM/ murein hydrolase activator NlpD